MDKKEKDYIKKSPNVRYLPFNPLIFLPISVLFLILGHMDILSNNVMFFGALGSFILAIGLIGYAAKI